MTVVNAHKLIGEALKVMPGVFAMLDNDMSIVSSSGQWDQRIGSLFKDADVSFRNQFEDAFNTVKEESTSYFIQDILKRQTRFKWKFTKIGDENDEFVLVQRVLLMRPAEYRKRYLLSETNKVAAIGYWEVNLGSGRVTWSDVTRVIHRVPADYVPDLEHGINFYKEGESRDRITKVIEQAIATGEPWDEDFTLITYDNEEVEVNARGQAEFEDGKCVRLLGTFQDITDRVRRNRKLQNSEEQFRLAFENSPIGFLIVGVIDFQVLRVNKVIEKIFGFNKKQFLNKKENQNMNILLSIIKKRPYLLIGYEKKRSYKIIKKCFNSKN